MKEFFRLERVPQFDVRQAPFPVAQAFHRQFTLSPDYANRVHRWFLSGLIQKLIERDRALQREAQGKLAQEGVLGTIRSFERARPGESFQPDFVDLYYLYSHIRAHRPATVLEFGSGVSTAVMAHALARNGQGRLFSLEASEDWAKSSSNSLPSDLKRYATVEYRPPVAVNILGQATYCFEAPPVDSADLIYVDGAAHEKASFQGAENLEYLVLRPDTCIYLDHRLKAVEFYFKRRTAEADLHWSSAKWRCEMHCYQVIAKDFASPLNAPCGADLFSNTLVRVL